MVRPPLPPFTDENAALRVRLNEDAWNTRDPARVALGFALEQLVLGHQVTAALDQNDQHIKSISTDAHGRPRRQQAVLIGLELELPEPIATR